MIIRSEALKPNIRDMDAIMHEYYEKTVAKHSVPPLDFDWDHYLTAEANNKFVLIVARDAEELIGFATYYVSVHPQYKTTMYAFCNTLAVKLKYRGQGVASKLVKAAEPYLKLYNVKYMVHGFRTVYDVEPLFQKLGFELYEKMYQKVL